MDYNIYDLQADVEAGPESADDNEWSDMALQYARLRQEAYMDELRIDYSTELTNLRDKHLYDQPLTREERQRYIDLYARGNELGRQHIQFIEDLSDELEDHQWGTVTTNTVDNMWDDAAYGGAYSNHCHPVLDTHHIRSLAATRRIALVHAYGFSYYFDPDRHRVDASTGVNDDVLLDERSDDQ